MAYLTSGRRKARRTRIGKNSMSGALGTPPAKVDGVAFELGRMTRLCDPGS